MRDDLETRLAALESALAEAQEENARIRKLISAPAWAYKSVEFPADFNALGEDGWELAGTTTHWAIFKRRLGAR